MILICEQCERGIEIPKHASEVTCSCGARYEIDHDKPDYKRIVTDRQGNMLDVRTMGHPHGRLIAAKAGGDNCGNNLQEE